MKQPILAAMVVTLLAAAPVMANATRPSTSSKNHGKVKHAKAVHGRLVTGKSTLTPKRAQIPKGVKVSPHTGATMLYHRMHNGPMDTKGPGPVQAQQQNTLNQQNIQQNTNSH